MKEQRKHTRLTIKKSCEIRLKSGKRLKGETKNISFGGALAKLSEVESVPKGENCKLFLLLQEGKEGVVIEFSCRIVHLSRKGVGLKFLRIDSDSYLHFKNLMVFNCDDPDKLLLELDQNPGLDLY